MSKLITLLTERITALETEILSFEDRNMIGACISSTGEISGLKTAIEAIKKEQLADRFFLEEAIFRNVKCWDDAEDYTDTLLHDWLKEMVRNNPLTEEERAAYIKNVLGWDAEFVESAYFASEKQLDHYLSTKEILEEVEDFSIVDESTNTD